MVVEVGDVVDIDCEDYCGKAFIRSWHPRGAYVSIGRTGR